MSFTEKLYLVLKKNGKNSDLMNFPYPSHSYGFEVFRYIANQLCLLLEEKVSSILLTERKYCFEVICKELENQINETFEEKCFKSEKIKNFIENKPDFSFPPMNIECAKIHNINPGDYLRCIFEQAANTDSWSEDDWKNLLPWNIKITSFEAQGVWTASLDLDMNP